MDSEALLQQALELPTEARAKIANRLIESLDESTQDQDVEQAWALEIKKRISELENGTVETISASDFLSELRESARGAKKR